MQRRAGWHHIPSQRWCGYFFPLSRLLSWGSWLQGWNFAWKYVLLSEEGGQAASVRSLNVKFSHCPECYLHKFLGECVIWCYHSFFLSVCLFLAFMSAHLVILLAFHWMSVTECTPEGAQHELWHMTEGKKKQTQRRSVTRKRVGSISLKNLPCSVFATLSKMMIILTGAMIYTPAC